MNLIAHIHALKTLKQMLYFKSLGNILMKIVFVLIISLLIHKILPVLMDIGEFAGMKFFSIDFLNWLTNFDTFIIFILLFTPLYGILFYIFRNSNTYYHMILAVLVSIVVTYDFPSF